MELYARFKTELDTLESAQRLRCIVSRPQSDYRILSQGQWLYNLSSNDYLGLGHDRQLYEKFSSSLPEDAKLLSSSGSLLLTGAYPSYERTLAALEHAYGRKVVLFSSGFAANSSAIAALTDEHTLILADKLSHASILQGLSQSRGKALRFAHNSLEHLRTLLHKYASAYDNILIVTEAVFSMDGDQAPLQELCALKHEFPHLYLYVDEAHSFGVFGREGLGLCVEKGVLSEVDFVLCTLGKACGSAGAFLLVNELTQSYLINKAQSLIFSTALPPLMFEHMRFMFEELRRQDERRVRLFSLRKKAVAVLTELGFQTSSGSQILPLFTGSEELALKAASCFKEHGLLAMPIRHPTVPVGKARLRLSLTASLPDDFIAMLRHSVAHYKHGFVS